MTASSLRSRIIVSLLLNERKLVKSLRFADYKYIGDPVNVVKIFNEKSVDELSIYDIKAWHSRRIEINLLKTIAQEARMPLCYGGGIVSADQASQIIQIGYEKIAMSRAPLEQPKLIGEIAKAIGSQSVACVIDVKSGSQPGSWDVYTENARRKIAIPLHQLIQQYQNEGCGEIIFNSIDRDGTRTGFDTNLIRYASAQTNVPITFLGGAGGIEDMRVAQQIIEPIGLAAGTMFSLHGKHRAVLLKYQRPEE